MRALTTPRGPSGGSRMQALRALAFGLLGLVAMLLSALSGAQPAYALKPISVTSDQERIELGTVAEAYEGRGDTLQIETAPGTDGAAGRMSVRASTAGTSPGWLVFALHNPTDKTIELWLTADRYNPVGSGVVWPDLDAKRIETVSHSAGFVPERIKSDRADIFRLTIERGQTITYVAELASDRYTRISLRNPLEYEMKLRDRYLFNGIMLGITGILAVFLTAVFAANHKLIFPSTALVSWCVLALLCVDFGFWHKLFQMRPEENAQYRAAAEAAVAASLVIFLFAFLRVNLWHAFARMLFLVWIAAQLAIIATAVLDPRLAATVARLSMALIGLLGGVVILFMALRNFDRALALMPTWILFLVWLFGAAVTFRGQISGEVVISGLVAGLVLIMVLIGFTVTQFAFRSTEPVYGSNPTQQQLRLAALDRAGVAVWEWSARHDEIKLDPVVEATLGLGQGELPTKCDEFSQHLHPADRDRFQTAVAAVKERGGGGVHLELRVRHADSSYRWFELEGASMPVTDRRALRCCGVVRDVTDVKRAQERLMHDAVHDSLTGLPNRELFLDRLGVALARAATDRSVRPTVFFFDIDKFKSVNSSFGLIVGDSILLTVSRRLARNLKPSDTLARVGGDQFALMLPGEQDPRELAMAAERLRLALRSPIRIAGQEIVLTSSIGVAVQDGTQADAADLLREAEVAMTSAKRAGSDRIEIFRPEMRGEKDDRIAIESELRRAIEARQLKILYQPIVSLSNEELQGFEALVRWQHPKLGLLSPADFVPVAEETDLIVQLGSYVLNHAAQDLARWQKELPRPEQPLFVNVNVSSRQLIKPDLVQEVRHVIGRAVLPASSLRLEITESLVMENPEQATHILELLKELGVGLALDDFGTGYSSLAYLNRFPFDTIKIDKALVHASAEGDRNSIIVRSIVALAHELGKRIVAEGVETQEDAVYLRSIGCQYAQGFHYGEPMDEKEIARLLRLIRKSERRMRRRGMTRGQEKRKGGEAPVAPPEAQVNGAMAPGLQSGLQPAPTSGAPGQRPVPSPAAANAGGRPQPRPPEPGQMPTGRPVTQPYPQAMPQQPAAAHAPSQSPPPSVPPQQPQQQPQPQQLQPQPAQPQQMPQPVRPMPAQQRQAAAAASPVAAPSAPAAPHAMAPQQPAPAQPAPPTAGRPAPSAQPAAAVPPTRPVQPAAPASHQAATPVQAAGLPPTRPVQQAPASQATPAPPQPAPAPAPAPLPHQMAPAPAAPPHQIAPLPHELGAPARQQPRSQPQQPQAAAPAQPHAAEPPRRSDTPTTGRPARVVGVTQPGDRTAPHPAPRAAAPAPGATPLPAVVAASLAKLAGQLEGSTRRNTTPPSAEDGNDRAETPSRTTAAE